MYVYHISRDRVIKFLMKFYYYFQIQLNDILLIARSWVVHLVQDTPRGPQLQIFRSNLQTENKLYPIKVHQPGLAESCENRFSIVVGCQLGVQAAQESLCVFTLRGLLFAV